jgi:site-specific recombinase XerD
MGVFAFSNHTPIQIDQPVVHKDSLMRKEYEMSYPYLSRAIEGFLLSKSSSGRSPNTIRNYKQELGRFVEWLGDIPIDEISSNQLKEYLKYLRDDFRITHVATTPISPRKLSSKSLRNTWGTLSSFWTWASNEFDFDSPFDLIPIKAHTKPINPLNMDEIGKLLKGCETSMKLSRGKKTFASKRRTCKRDRAIILTLLDTGMRVSELCGINIEDVNFETGRIFVTGKGNKSRYVYLGKVSRQAIWRYLIERFPSEKPPLKEPLFISYDGIHRLSRQGVLLLLKRLGKKAGIPNVYPHRFRHTFSVQFLRNGGNVFELQQLLGHSDLAMVKRYVRVASLDLEMIVKKASPADNWRLR